MSVQVFIGFFDVADVADTDVTAVAALNATDAVALRCNDVTPVLAVCCCWVVVMTGIDPSARMQMIGYGLNNA